MVEPIHNQRHTPPSKPIEGMSRSAMLALEATNAIAKKIRAANQKIDECLTRTPPLRTRFNEKSREVSKELKNGTASKTKKISKGALQDSPMNPQIRSSVGKYRGK